MRDGERLLVESEPTTKDCLQKKQRIQTCVMKREVHSVCWANHVTTFQECQFVKEYSDIHVKHYLGEGTIHVFVYKHCASCAGVCFVQPSTSGTASARLTTFRSLAREPSATGSRTRRAACAVFAASRAERTSS